MNITLFPLIDKWKSKADISTTIKMGYMTMSHAVTANRLADGRVVFRTADGSWSGSIRDAAVADSEAAAAPALSGAQADADNQIIVDPYLIEVDLSGSAPRPARLREAIRAFGPTIAYGPAPLLEAAE
jgi:hypothetical protein